jgi:ADP-ribose pyrophosphatase YjhB (NUDIX family)
MSKAIDVPTWLGWAREIQALAQTGKRYALNDFQIERYDRFAEIAAEIIAKANELEAEAFAKEFKAQIGYATPRIDVRGAVFREGKLLMVREKIDGGWTMPGGWADVGDVPSEAAEREVWEEAGFRVKARKVIGVYDANRVEGWYSMYHSYKLVFYCEILSGEAQPSNETSEVQFFGMDEIPMNLSGERTSPRLIEHAFHVMQEPDCPTMFD